MRRVIARPRPGPFESAIGRFLDLLEFCKDAVLISRCDPDPGILDRQMHDLPAL